MKISKISKGKALLTAIILAIVGPIVWYIAMHGWPGTQETDGSFATFLGVLLVLVTLIVVGVAMFYIVGITTEYIKKNW